MDGGVCVGFFGGVVLGDVVFVVFAWSSASVGGGGVRGATAPFAGGWAVVDIDARFVVGGVLVTRFIEAIASTAALLSGAPLLACLFVVIEEGGMSMMAWGGADAGVSVTCGGIGEEGGDWDCRRGTFESDGGEARISEGGVSCFFFFAFFAFSAFSFATAFSSASNSSLVGLVSS